MKKQSIAVILSVLVAVCSLSACKQETLPLNFFGTDIETLRNDLSDKIGENIPEFTLFTKTEANVYVYITRVNNVYITIYIAENYNGLDVSLAYQDLNDETIKTFGTICGASISVLDPFADAEELINSLGMNTYETNSTYNYETENFKYEYSITSSAIYFSMNKS